MIFNPIFLIKSVKTQTLNIHTLLFNIFLENGYLTFGAQGWQSQKRQISSKGNCRMYRYGSTLKRGKYSLSQGGGWHLRQRSTKASQKQSDKDGLRKQEGRTDGGKKLGKEVSI